MTCEVDNIWTDKYSSPIQDCQNNYVFDKSVFQSTIVTDFNLVCGNEWKTDLSTSLYYLGFGVGGIVGGIVSDRFGRKPIMILGSFLLLITGIANSWSNNIWTFAFVRFLIGCSVNFTKIVAFTYIIEILGAKQRSYSLDG